MTPATVTSTLFGALALQRLAEVVVSRRNVRARTAHYGAPVSEGPDSGPRRERALYAVHAAFFVLPLAEALLRGWPGPLLPYALGLPLLLGAQLVRGWSVAALGAGWRIPVLAFPGEPIVTRGPYALARHPNHGAVLVEFLVAPLLAGAPLAWLALNIVHTPFLLARVRREERALARIGPYAALFAGRPSFLPRPNRRAGAPAACDEP